MGSSSLLLELDCHTASHTSRQPSNPRRHPICWASSQWSHNVSRTPCHGPWTSAPLGTHPSIECCCTALRIKHPFVPAAQQLIGFSDSNNIHVAQWAEHQWNAEQADSPTRLCTFVPDTTSHTPGLTLPKGAWVRLNRLRTSVGRFCSCFYKWVMASSATCEYGAEEQTVDHVVLQCPIHRPSHGLHDLTVLNDETTEWLLNTCPEI